MWKSQTSAYFEPDPSRDSLSSIAFRIAREVEEIEACIRMDASEVCGEFSLFSTRVKQHGIHQTLLNSAVIPVAMDCPKRQEWFDSCLARFRHYFATPSEWFEVVKEHKAFVVPSTSPAVRLTTDLITRQRFWGIQFYSYNRNQDIEIADLYLNAAMTRLASDLKSLNRFCVEWERDSAFLSTVSFSHDRRGNLFEQIVFGILNQLEPLVEITSIYDDVRQWADFRIVRNGAFKDTRIQVKFIHRRADHDVAEKHPRASKSIILSPLSIASSLETTFDQELFRCSWADFLAIFPVRPNTTEELAWQIYKFFDNLFDAPPSHPLSPIFDVPYQIRLAIHLFVAHEAAELRFKHQWRLASVKAADLGGLDPEP